METRAGSTDRRMFRSCFLPTKKKRSPLSPGPSVVVIRFCTASAPAMLHVALRKRAGRLGRRMEELDRSMDGVAFRSFQSMAIRLFCMFQVAAATRSPYVTCGSMWMPLSLSFVIFASYCFYLSSELRRLRRYGVEMERVKAKLSAARRRLLEQCMDHEASLAEIMFGSTTLTWGNLVCFVVSSSILTCALVWSAVFMCAG